AEVLLELGEAGEWPAALLALPGVRDGALEQPPLASYGASGQPGAAVVEDAHRHFEALALLPQDVGSRHAHVVEVHRGRVRGADAHLVLVRAVRDAAEVARDDERSDLPLLLRRVRSRLGEYRVEVG